MEKYSVKKLQDGVTFFPSMKDISEHHREWVYGDFVDGVKGSSFEVKISEHEKGELRSAWSEKAAGETLTIIMRGSINFFFLIDGEEHSEVVGSGQMVRYANNISHRWEVLEEMTQIVTVRSFLVP